MAGFIFMEENQSEIAILIDGNNFYKGLEKVACAPLLI